MAITVPATMVLDRALRDAGIPIDGVSIGDPLNRATWRVFYTASATAEQRTQGDALLQTLDVQDAATMANIKADLATNGASADVIRAVVQGLYGAIPNPTRTLGQVRNDILAIYRGLL